MTIQTGELVKVRYLGPNGSFGPIQSTTFPRGEIVEVSETLAAEVMGMNSRGCTTDEEARNYQMQRFELAEGGDG